MDSVEQVKSAIARARPSVLARRLETLRIQVRQELTRSPSLRASVYLFGSWATERFDGASDVDLLVVAPEVDTAREVQERLMGVADDVVAFSETDWQRKLATGEPFARRVADERRQLVTTRADAND